ARGHPRPVPPLKGEGGQLANLDGGAPLPPAGGGRGCGTNTRAQSRSPARPSPPPISACCPSARPRDAAQDPRQARPRGQVVIDYLRDPDAIYAQSFATIRAEADLAGLGDDMQDVAIRMIHACGMVEIAPHIRASDDVVEKI